MLVNYDCHYFALTGLFQWIPGIGNLGLLFFSLSWICQLPQRSFPVSHLEGIWLPPSWLPNTVRRQKPRFQLSLLSFHPIFSIISMLSILSSAFPHPHLNIQFLYPPLPHPRCDGQLLYMFGRGLMVCFLRGFQIILLFSVFPLPQFPEISLGVPPIK